MSVFVAAPGPVSGYCRLCASRAPPDSLLSFASNHKDSNSLLTAIRRLNSTIARGDGLPQSICSRCDPILKATTIFLQKVDYTQELLSRLFSVSESEGIKLENVAPTNYITSENLNIPSLPLRLSKEPPEDAQALMNTWHAVELPCQEGENSIKHMMQPTSTQLHIDKFSEGTNFDSMLDGFNTVECAGTSTMLRDQFYEMKMEFVENIISGRNVDGVTSKKSKRVIKKYSANSTSTEEAFSPHDSSEESSTNCRLLLPEFTEQKNADTDALAISNDEIKGGHIDESQASPLNLHSEVTLTDKAPELCFCDAKANDEAIEPSATIAEQIAQSTRGKTKVGRSSKKSKAKGLTRKTKNVSKGSQRKVKKVSNNSTLPLYNGFPTATEDLPAQIEDSNIERWSDHYFCKRCDVNFNTLQTLRQHWWDTHKRCITFKCTMCTVYILNYDRFFRHMISHKKNLQKCCEFCDKCFISAADTRYHKKLDHPEENRPHQCGSCGSSFETSIELQDHRDDYIVHQAKKAGDRRFKCKECGQEFLNKITLVSHMDNHDPTKNICNFCNKSCTSKYTLKEHIFIVHEGKLQFYCQICGKGFKRKSQLRVHLDAHDGVKRFSCCFCDKKFRDKSQLKSHQPTHSSVKPYVCEVCDKSYKFKCGLKSHVRTHEEGYVPYACDVCVKTFQSWSNYNKHMKRIHGKDMSKRNNMFKLSARFLT